MLERTTQPMTDAVIERPMTLVEKLEQEIESLENSFEQFAIVDDEIAMVHTATIAGLKMAINIVKKHSDWIPVSDLPKEEKDWLVRFKKEDCFGLTMAVSKFYLEAQKFDCFHSKVTHYMALPNPPSEVQGDQNCKTMPCSHDGYSDCKQAKLL